MDRTKIDQEMIAALKKVKGIVDVRPFDDKDKQEILNLEEKSEKCSLMGLGAVINVGIRDVLACDLVYVALTNMDFEWPPSCLILKKGDVVAGEEIRDKETIDRLAKEENVWLMMDNFVVYKDRVSFPHDLIKRVCHFEVPSIPGEWPSLKETSLSYQAVICAVPATPGDLFLKSNYQYADERGMGTILIGVKL